MGRIMWLSRRSLAPLSILVLSSCADGGADNVADAATAVDAAQGADAAAVDASATEDLGIGPVDFGGPLPDGASDASAPVADLGPLPDASFDMTVSPIDMGPDLGPDLGVDAGPTCAYSCVLSRDPRESTCIRSGSPVSLYGPGADTEAGTLVSVVDMGRYAAMTVTAEICNPMGWLIDLCDSSTCNGYGGDSSTMSHCAELQLLGTTLSAYGSAYTTPTPGGLLFSQEGVLESRGCSTLEFTVRDSSIRIPGESLDWRSENLLRINPPRDENGRPDALWYLSLNRVNYPDSTDRVGAGVERVTLCFN